MWLLVPGLVRGLVQVLTLNSLCTTGNHHHHQVSLLEIQKEKQVKLSKPMRFNLGKANYFFGLLIL
jgi:hypothetical protein|tara:strand:- start:686 stop:883 length:198 start_codon:yes stop_codon:yes gene_type:complete